MKLTDEQEKILKECDDNIYISSSPGSGKSTMLSKITGKLLVVDPRYRIMLVTFTNKAAKSIVDKCAGEDQTRIMGGTFHGLTYRLLRENGIDRYICDESKKRLIIKKLFNCSKDKEKYERIYELISKSKSKYPLREDSSTLDRYQAELEKYNLMDFDDIIYNGIVCFSSDGISFPMITHILVDELQDTSGPQLELLKAFRTKTNQAKMIGVADDDQCHPQGNKVLTTDGYVDIKHLNTNIHKVPAYDGHGKLYGLNNPNGYIIQKSKRLYTGLLYRIATKDKSFECTYNHKCYVQWIKSEANKVYITYLMRQGDKFRLGQCKLIQRDGILHLGVRERIEKADAVWILGVHNNRQSSLKEEAILSTKYRLPTVTFKETNCSIHFKQEILDEIFNSINKDVMYCDALDILELYDRDIEYPIWTSSNYVKQGARTFFITQACNIIPNIMCVGEYNGSRKLEKKVIIKLNTRDVYNEEVYSLNVEKFHNYICEGILVSNSIYAWRGARPANVRDFINTFQCTIFNMGYNFRSCVRIVEKSKKLIENNKERIKKTIRAFKKEQGIVSDYMCQSPFEEIDYVIMRCLQHRKREIGILYRNRTFKNHLEFEMRKSQLEYTVNDFLEITDRSAIKIMLSVLKICAREFDLYDLQNAAKAIKGFGNASVIKLEKDATDVIPVNRVFYFHSKNNKQNKRLKSLIELQKYYDANQEHRLDGLVREIEKYFNKSFDYVKEMRSFFIDIAKDYTTTSGAIKRLNNELGLNGKEEHNDDGALIELSTVHGYKGLERDIIILPWCQAYMEAKPGKIIKEEEERRLFYVAATRAKEKLYMCYSGDTPQFIKEMKL